MAATQLKNHQSTAYSASPKRDINWPRVLFYIHVHLIGILAIGVLSDTSFLTILFSITLTLLGVVGVRAGAHRLWAHHAYEANTVLKVLLMLCHTLAGQGTIYDWVVKHRIHHKYYGTDKDPYNHNKGFWYSHLLTNIMGADPRDKQLRKEIDVEDLENDGVVIFQKNFYWLVMPIICILLPINAPMEYWGETMINAIFVAGFLRYALTCNLAWLVNSGIHIWGLTPGERYPADTMLVFILTKSHWISYHYIVPWDYQAGELGSYGSGFTTTLVRVWAAMGWAHNLRTIDSNSIKEAIYTSTTTGKHINDCVQDIMENDIHNAIPKDHYLTSKFL